MLSPILFFAYKRLEHTRSSINALLKNDLASESHLIVFCDGAKTPDEEESVNRVRDYFKSVVGFGAITINERPLNLGLSKSIISGVDEVLLTYPKAIVLEDDLITSPHFLRYMNEALAFYENNEAVISVHGWVCPTKKKLPGTFFLRGADCWGWGTWSRSWNLLQRDPKVLLDELNKKKLTHEFDFHGAYPYTSMLESCIEGRVDSWAIRWHASAFLLNKLTLYPCESLVNNIGNDGTGTHKGNSKNFDVSLSQNPILVKTIDIEPSDIGFSVFREYFLHNESYWSSILKRALKKLNLLCS